MSSNPVIMEIVEKNKPIWALDHTSALLEWDMETYMPLGSSKSRGFAIAQTALMRQQRTIELATLCRRLKNLVT